MVYNKTRSHSAHYSSSFRNFQEITLTWEFNCISTIDFCSRYDLDFSGDKRQPENNNPCRRYLLVCFTLLAHVSSHALDDEKRVFFLFVARYRYFVNDYSLCAHDKITVPIWSEHLVKQSNYSYFSSPILFIFNSWISSFLIPKLMVGLFGDFRYNLCYFRLVEFFFAWRLISVLSIYKVSIILKL